MTTREKPQVTRYEFRHWGLSVVLLIAVACIQMARYRPPPQTAAYFQRVVDAAATVPNSFGPWVSINAPVPPAAEKMLQPNLIVSRKYTNLQTGQQATFLLVQCGDAQSLQGHYPPVCYKGSGFLQVDAFAKDWRLEGLTIQGMVYTFVSARPEALSSMIIYDFMILPNGLTCRDMQGVSALARDQRRRRFGAAQLQVLFDPSMPEEQREAVFFTLVQAHRKTIDAILAGDAQ